jgi:hypothetical protein
MKERNVNTWLLLLFCVLGLSFVTVANAYGETEVQLKGTVFATDYDDKENVIAVSILEVGGEEYFVVNDEVGSQLLKLVDKNVKVTGVIDVDKDGKKRIRIKKYELVPS